MKRVLIIGCPGAGKTTFSKKLAQKTGLPLIHLDFYYHDKNFDYETNRPAWHKRVLELIKGKEWIIDGNYSSTFPERFEMADTIIWFDFPRHLRLAGILKRRWEFMGAKKRTDMPDTWRENINWEFFKFVWSFENYRPKIMDVINQKASKKIIIFKKRRDAQNFLDSPKPA